MGARKLRVDVALLLACAVLPAAAATGSGAPPLHRFVWPDRWSAVQEIHLVSGNFTGAVQVGLVEYDARRNWTREDQALIAGPSVKTPETSDNMTEFFRGTDWFYMDWTTGECQYANFGFGQVRPDFLINSAFPHIVGTTFINTYVGKHERGYVNTSYIHTDGSSGFGEPPGSSLFEYYVDADGNGRRLRMPSTLSSDLVIELKDFQPELTPAIADMPEACHKSRATQWTKGPITPMARRAFLFAEHHNSV